MAASFVIVKQWSDSDLKDKIDKPVNTGKTFKHMLKIRNLQDLVVFVQTADAGTLSAAARVLGLSPAVASASLKRLESDLRSVLFVRTTRSLRLTLEGERLLARSRPLLAGLQEAEEELTAGRLEVQGRLSISMPSDLGRNLLLPWLDDFQEIYPRLELQLHLSDRRADVYRQPVDVVIRYGKPRDSALVALPLLTDNRRVLCASGEYLLQRGKPRSPEELASHNCLCFMLDDALYNRWRFQRDGKDVVVEVRGDRAADDSDAVRRWALSGKGIIYRALLDVAEDIAAGRLQVLCPEWQGEEVPLYLACADRRQLSPTVRLLREFLEDRCRRHAGHPEEPASA
jgi:DNA-binding transcriptional LysR family regulator